MVLAMAGWASLAHATDLSVGLDVGNPKPMWKEIAFSVFHDDIGAVGQRETHIVLKSQEAYRDFFGHDAPEHVNFADEWVVFYSAGTKSTGGFEALIKRIVYAKFDRMLWIRTALVSPGPKCVVTFAFTKPHVLAKFRRPTPRPVGIHFLKDSSERNCGEPTPGPCPGTGTRNPKTGKCECNVQALCITGSEFNSDPAVCACASPCDGVRCPVDTHCESLGNSVACVSDAAQCRKDSDCRLVDSYCRGCDCLALGPNDPEPTCPEPPVQCFAQPCAGKVARCEDGRCVAKRAPAGEKCGPKVCGQGQVCCNSSCGICTPPDGACTQQACINN
jgi:hypothetical protein